MFCELCRVEFSSSTKKVLEYQLKEFVEILYKTKSHKPVCLDCYYDNKSLSNSNEQLHLPTASSISVLAVEDVSLLEYRFRRLKGLTDDKPTSSSIFSLSKTDEVSKLVQQYVEEAQISAECGSDLSLEDDPIKPENLPSCYMCEGIAEFLCKECDDNFCKRCFNKTHNKRERLEHATGMCKL
ncbi:zinc finger FYVE domain containing 19 [Schistosoma japonicum]|nr:zinc finger FYVE domain containing 19 [Schistosoma japonicum]